MWRRRSLVITALLALCAVAMAQTVATLTSDPHDPLTVVLTVTSLPQGAAKVFVNWGDGQSVSLPSAQRTTHRYAKAGSYSVRLVDGAHAALLYTATARVHAPTPPPGPSRTTGPRISNLKGYVSTDYFASSTQGQAVSYGAGQGVLRGLSVSASLSLDVPDRHVTLTASNVNLQHQSVRLQLSNRKAALSLALDDIPADGTVGSRTTLLGALSVTDPGLPKILVTGVAASEAGSTGYHMSSVQLGLSDSYKAVAPGITRLHWRTTLQTTGSAVASNIANGQATQTLSAGIGATFAPWGPNALRLTPRLDEQIQWTQTTGAAGTSSQHHRLSLDVRPDKPDDAALSVSLATASAAAPTNQETLRLSTERLAPVTLRATVSRSNDGSADSYTYSAGADVPVAHGLDVTGGYRGGSGTDGTYNGATAGLKVAASPGPWTFGAAVHGGLQLYTDGKITPSADGSLSAQVGTPAAHGSAQGSLQYDGTNLNASLDLTGGFKTGAFTLDGSAGLQANPTLAVKTGLKARLRMLAALSLQAQAGYRASFASDTGSVATIGLGLRYDFGGSD
ncbi:MAG: PKD domain-containing protein [Deinococcales bacterium]